MSINVSLQVVPFGQIVLKVGLSTYKVQEPLPIPVEEEIQYHEPQQTASLVYEQQLNNFVVPSSTAYY